MADNTQIPQDLLNLYALRPTTDPLRRFLQDLLTRVSTLEAANKDLTTRVKKLEAP